MFAFEFSVIKYCLIISSPYDKGRPGGVILFWQ
jgi:hypothetical protein